MVITENINSEEKGKLIVYDARPDLAKKIHPVDKVLAALANLEKGEKYLLITPFPPAPLIIKAKENGFNSEEEKRSADEYYTYFFKS